MPIRRQPAYQAIAAQLRAAIDGGRLEAGTVLRESHLSALFHASRAPVRQALDLLEGEGRLGRFDGRGRIVGRGHAPRRTALQRDQLGLTVEAEGRDAAPYYAVERAIILQSVHGPARISELALARELGLGRMAAHELLRTAEGAGIVERAARGGRWQVVALDRTRVDHLYALRCLAEPEALRLAAPHVTPGLLTPMLRRVEGPGPRGEAASDRIERDLHDTLIGLCPNRELTLALRRTRCTTVAGKHVVALLGEAPDGFAAEHAHVLQALAEGCADEAARALALHLDASRGRVLQRLALLAGRAPAAPPAWMR